MNVHIYIRKYRDYFDNWLKVIHEQWLSLKNVYRKPEMRTHNF